MTTENKEWDAPAEYIRWMIRQLMDNFTQHVPATRLKAIEANLAKWHRSRGSQRGTGHSGCCYFFEKCMRCPLFAPVAAHGISYKICCNGLFETWARVHKTDAADEAAEKVYQYTLGKYWEEKNMIRNRTLCEIKQERA